MTQDLVGGMRSIPRRKALVCGAGGFIGGHLIKKLKREGYWVRGVDIKSAWTEADEYTLLDLRRQNACIKALWLASGHPFDEVYQLAANFGGIGFITNREREIVYDNTLINLNMSDLATRMGVPRYFFSSSVCVYRDMGPDEAELTEDDAYRGIPENEYGWEKLYAERVAMTFGRNSDTRIRIARFQTVYGPGEYWQGGREKAPAVMCRKVAEADDGGIITIWNGTAIRGFTYVSDVVDGVYILMQSDLQGPVNIGTDERVTINDLVETVAEVAGKKIHIAYDAAGPMGHRARNFSKARIKSLGWEARVSLKEGIGYSYPVIEAQVRSV